MRIVRGGEEGDDNARTGTKKFTDLEVDRKHKAIYLQTLFEAATSRRLRCGPRAMTFSPTALQPYSNCGQNETKCGWIKSWRFRHCPESCSLWLVDQRIRTLLQNLFSDTHQHINRVTRSFLSMHVSHSPFLLHFGSSYLC